MLRRRFSAVSKHEGRIHPSRRAPGALLRMRSAHAASVDHYSFGLIAQVTLTVTDSVSSPCATCAPAAMGAAILPRYSGTEEPSSEILSGSPSVTPAALA